MRYAELGEICEIMDFLVNRENDETLLRAYQASYAALQNIPFDEFRRRAAQKTELRQAAAPTPEQVHEKVERILEDYKWTEV